MKLRLRGNSIRLRLNRPEVAQFASRGTIEEALCYGAGAGEQLTYGLERSASAQDIQLSVAPGRIMILVPESLARDWVDTERVSMESTSRTTAPNELTILVKKDFRRLHGASKDPDLYPNPLEKSGV